MKSLQLISLLLIVTVSLTSSSVDRRGSRSSNATKDFQVIDVTAKKYEFNPSPIRVKQGTRVQFKITATDHTHGFTIEEFPQGADRKGKAGLIFSALQECYRIEKGQTVTVDFVARTPGTYPFKCCVHCGLHHKRMKGQLIVEP